MKPTLEEHKPLNDAERVAVKLLAEKFVRLARAAAGMLEDPSAQESNTDVLRLGQLALRLLDDLRACEIERNMWRKEWDSVRTQLHAARHP